jgi:anthranilate synthase component 1
VYRKLAGGRPGTFLLESAEQGRQWSRWSFVGVRSAGVLTERDGEALWVGEGLRTTSRDPLEAVREAVELLRSPKGPDDPPLTGGLVGYLGYDVVRRMERLPSTAPDELGMPELAMMLVTDLAVLDHGDGTVLLVANVLPGGSYADAVARLDAMTTALAEPAPGTVSTVDLAARPDVVRRTTPQAYEAAVEAAKEHVRAGDVFRSS